jgi:pimeloyl-ACP methyl ester carboxylesterase
MDTATPPLIWDADAAVDTVAVDGDSVSGDLLQDVGGDSLYEGDGSETAALGDTGPDVPVEPEWILSTACDDDTATVYVTPDGALDEKVALGTVLRCAMGSTISAAGVATQAEPLGVTTTRGVETLRIAYRTQRGAYGPGVGSAKVFLPSPQPDGPISLVLMAHGTAGLADKCAPSKQNDTIPEMAIPFAGHDMVVVAPDYAGLGNEGVQGYGDSRDTAYSALDAVRAVQALLAGNSLKSEVLVLGHSQGGGVALYAQGLAAEYLPEYPLAGVVSFAPGWTATAEQNSAFYAAPQFVPVSAAAGVRAATLVLALYADAANHVDPLNPGFYFHPTYREEIVAWIESKCVFGIASQFEAMAGVTLKDILESAFFGVSLSCIQGDPGCSEPYAGFIARQEAKFIPLDKGGAPVLFVQGLDDKQATPVRAACFLASMKDMGVVPQVCVDVTAGHFNVVLNTINLAAAWLRAQRDGTDVPTCEWGQELLPPCQ